MKEPLEPSSRILVTTVASSSGMNPVIRGDPFNIGTPATSTLSLIANFLPFSFPLDAPLMSVLYHLFSERKHTIVSRFKVVLLMSIPAASHGHVETKTKVTMACIEHNKMTFYQRLKGSLSYFTQNVPDSMT